jgi:hypothetical protein
MYLYSKNPPPAGVVNGIGHPPPPASSGVIFINPLPEVIVQPALPARVKKVFVAAPTPRGATSAPLTTSAVVKKKRFTLNIIVLLFKC